MTDSTVITMTPKKQTGGKTQQKPGGGALSVTKQNTGASKKSTGQPITAGGNVGNKNINESSGRRNEIRLGNSGSVHTNTKNNRGLDFFDVATRSASGGNERTQRESNMSEGGDSHSSSSGGRQSGMSNRVLVAIHASNHSHATSSLTTPTERHQQVFGDES